MRDLIHRDMESEQERRYILGELLRSADEIAHGQLISAKAAEAQMDTLFANWDKQDAQAGR